MIKGHELRLAKRMARLGTETAFEVLVKAKALEAKGRDIIHLEIGEPDFDTPRNIIDAGCDALHKGFTHYGPSAGLMELREVIAQHVSETRQVSVTPDEVVVVPGGKPIIFFIILNSPQNPTGGVLEKKDIDGIARAIDDRNIMVLSDEIYSRLIFDGEHHSIMSVDGMKERTILLDGFSKTYAMTGWRMGYGVMRAELATHIARLMTNSASCTASFTQVAGIEALRGSQAAVDAMR
ncbi:MAG: aspartate aminotransferase, partial [Verrucomicrobia bacterium]